MLRHPWTRRLLSLVLVALATSLSASRAGAVSVQVAPADTVVTFGDSFYVRVTTDAFADLKAYQLIYSYGPSIQYQGAVAGDLLSAPFVVNDLSTGAPGDTAWVDCAQLQNSTAGPGNLIYFKFKAVAYHDAPIECLTVDFRDSVNQSTLPGCTGALIHVTGPTATKRTSWGKVKSIYR